ncbi:MAG: peptidylprolyl isomerase [Anaerolineales bacterium]|nr:peptidylprolyl isomerase [Anaerolineales bacterium]
MTNNMKVADNMVVALDYVLRFEDGEEVDRSEAGDPLLYLQGHNQIIPGLESALAGMAVGEEKDVIVQPADGYGEYDADDQEELPRAAFPEDMELEVGMDIVLRDAQSDEQYQAFVKEVRPDTVLVDFNHPLAGKSLHFQVKIVELRTATPEELAHGHAH